MLPKCLICFVMCAVIAVTAVTCYVKAPGEAPYSPQELPCLSNGGICVQKGDCPEGQLAEIQGLCPSGPKQRSQCCHGLPLSATGCRDKGGQCVEMSYECSTSTRADDCAENEHCCILVN